MSDGERTVHVIPRSDGEKVRATVSRFKGGLYASLRMRSTRHSARSAPTSD